MTKDVPLRSAHLSDATVLGALKLRASLVYGVHVEKLMAMREAGQIASDFLNTRSSMSTEAKKSDSFQWFSQIGPPRLTNYLSNQSVGEEGSGMLFKAAALLTLTHDAPISASSQINEPIHLRT